MAPGQEVEVRVELTPLRRGILRFTGVTLARPDPLGLFRALTTVPLPQTVLILPKRYPLPAIALPGTVKISGRRRGPGGAASARARSMSRCATTATAIPCGTFTGGAGPGWASRW